MQIDYKNIKLNISEKIKDENSNNFILMLHGFTGSNNDWQFVTDHLIKNFNVITLDLVGHGKSSSPEELDYYKLDSIIEQILQVKKHFNLNSFSLLGYSMGGRIALNFALRFPHLINNLILESTTAGIEDENQRKERVKSDLELAEFIENNSIENFIDYWMNLDIFNTQRRFSNEKINDIRNKKLGNNKLGLAKSLRGFSAGLMQPVYDQLKNMEKRTLLITGDLDSKYTEINNKILKLLPNAEHKIIKNAGHNVHLEEPKEFIKTVNDFLSTNDKSN